MGTVVIQSKLTNWGVRLTHNSHMMNVNLNGTKQTLISCLVSGKKAQTDIVALS